jgi:hypothetical protein
MKILSILVRAGTQRYPEAEAQLDALFLRQMPSVIRTSLVVDNALPAEVEERSGEGRIVIGGDNSVWEFSAFDRAVQYIGSRIWDFDLVHLATSAFGRLYVAYLDRFSEAVLHAIRGRSACLGHIDCYDSAVTLRHYRFQHWIRTAFFFLPPVELRALRSFVSFSDARSVFDDDPGHPFLANAPLCGPYRDYIARWLMGADIGQGVQWHSPIALTPDNLALFKSKATAIINEHLLSVRLRALGCRTIDVTWLSGQLQRMPPGEVAWDAGWQTQLASRDQDRIVVA